MYLWVFVCVSIYTVILVSIWCFYCVFYYVRLIISEEHHAPRHLLNPVYTLWYVFCFFVVCIECTVMIPFGALGWSQLSSNALPCSLCSTVKLARPAGEASWVLMATHGLDTLPEGLQNIYAQWSGSRVGADIIYSWYFKWGTDDNQPTCLVHCFHLYTIQTVWFKTIDCCF